MISNISKQLYRFSQLFQKIPQINLNNFLGQRVNSKQCEFVGEALRKYGCIIVRDPRISVEMNLSFLEMMRKYFIKRQQQLDQGIFLDIYRQHQYQVGLSPPSIMKIYEQSQKVKNFRLQNKPLTPFPPTPLKGMRFLWNIGNVADEIPKNKLPQDFPQFQKNMNEWGHGTLNSVITVTEMLQLGLGLKIGAFSSKLIGGANKLAPLGFNLKKVQYGEAFAGIHDDFGFLTVHGNSTFPGLFIWLSSGQKIKVRVPPGYLFMQAGTQLQHVTGGYIQSGLHESINTQQVQKLANQQIQEGKQPWRITSTMFTHLHTNSILQPEARFLNNQTISKYGAVRQHENMMNFLKQRQRK